ncbi:MAG TPA: hypothetical protein ENK57_03305 [Polyangiaceae bacterium]|nr:hypothetical protein [Polyangiaceae bacterium]
MNRHVKAEQLAREGRVRLLHAEPDAWLAVVEGSEPRLVAKAGDLTHCSCPARISDCSHQLAAALEVAKTIRRNP